MLIAGPVLKSSKILLHLWLCSEVVGKSSEVVGNHQRSLELYRNLRQSSEAVGKSSEIDQFRYIKIQPRTIDLVTRLWGITRKFVGFIPQQFCSQGLSSFFRDPGNEIDSPEPHTKVYCVSLRLNFNILKMVLIRFCGDQKSRAFY